MTVHERGANVELAFPADQVATDGDLSLPAATFIRNTEQFGLGSRIMMGTPTRGTIRMEWHGCLSSQIIPANWEVTSVPSLMSTLIPVRFQVADAQNLIVSTFLQAGHEWLLLLEDDVLAPPHLFLALNGYMRRGDVPVVSGLYYLKTEPAEPLVYRGRGTGAHTDFERGDLVWCDGVPTGCLLIHRSILQAMWDESQAYQAGGQQVRRVFENPTLAWIKDGYISTRSGTSDLEWCRRVVEDRIFEKAGWPDFQGREFPFLVDTSLFCGHITLEGKCHPSDWSPQSALALRRT